jgi:thiol-disulfide isomerase/thioredoxin
MKTIFLIVVSFFFSGFLFSQEIKTVKITEVEKIIAESKTPLIINVWATWCKPCIEELPYFMEEVNKHNKKAGPGDSIHLFLVSLDFKEAFPSAISSFAKKRKITAPIVWLDETNADYFCPKIDAKWSGAIPATLFVNNKTGYRHFAEAQLSHDELKKYISEMLAGISQ